MYTCRYEDWVTFTCGVHLVKMNGSVSIFWIPEEGKYVFLSTGHTVNSQQLLIHWHLPL